MDFLSALGASATSLGNIGPGLASVGPGRKLCSCASTCKMDTHFSYATRALRAIYGYDLVYEHFLEKKWISYARRLDLELLTCDIFSLQ